VCVSPRKRFDWLTIKIKTHCVCTQREFSDAAGAGPDNACFRKSAGEEHAEGVFPREFCSCPVEESDKEGVVKLSCDCPSCGYFTHCQAEG
jgi:hypothetical protein